MRLFLITVCALAALTSACDGERSVRIARSVEVGDTTGGGVLRVVETLQCPDTIGALTRKGSAQAGGTVCTYGGPRGAEVSLHLVALNTDNADGVLEAFEGQLAADMPATVARMRGAEATAEAARADAEAARADAEVARADAEAARADAEAARATAGDRADVRMPGLDVNADGDQARVRIPGISVDADGENARVRIGGMTIEADENSSNVSIASDDESVSVQARDDAAEVRTRASGPSTRVTYLLTDETPSPAGWRLVGYEARGPQGGPLVIATVRAKDRDNDNVFDAAKDLVTLNVGE